MLNRLIIYIDIDLGNKEIFLTNRKSYKNLHI